MAASSSDRFTQVGSPGTATTLSAPGHAIAGTSITVGSTSNWPTATGAIFAIDTVTLINGVEVRDVGSYTEWEGVVSSGTTVTSMVLRYGTDQNYPAGATTRVYIPVSSSRENRLADGILIEHKQTGAHAAVTADSVNIAAAGALTTDTVSEKTAANGVTIDGLNVKDSKLTTANSVVTTNYTNNSVTAPKLATDAIKLGYAQITSTFTTSSTSAVQVTGLTASVTIPAGGRSIEITAYTGGLTQSTAANYAAISIWDGVVNAGTLLTQANAGPTSNTNQGTIASVILTPAAGAKTYNVGLQTTGGTAGVTAAATNPAYLLIKNI